MVGDHPTAGELLDAHYGEGTAERRETVSAHAAGCPECQATLHELEWLDRSLDAAPEQTPPPGGLDAVLERVSSSGGTTGRALGWLGPVAASVAGTGSVLGLAYAVVTLLVTRAQVTPLGAAEAASALSGLGLAVAWVTAAGSVVTLALAPVLLMESRSARRRAATSGG